MRSVRRKRCLVALVLAALAVPGTARAVQEQRAFLIDPRESWVGLDPASAIVFEPAAMGLRIPLTPQPGHGRTPLTGTIDTLVELPGLESIRIERPYTLIVPLDVAPGLPGVPGASSTPALAQAAGRFSDPVFGIEGTVALRDAALAAEGIYATEAVSPGRVTFPRVTPGFPRPSLSLSAGRGFVDLEVPGIGLQERIDLARQGLFPPFPSDGTLEDLGEGRLRLTLPLDLTIALQNQLSGPSQIDARLTGRLVAYSPTLPVPEPSVGGGLAAALGALLGLRARRRPEATR
ncbi:MAG: PEP-CTERM sorting domain-containing protein [Myxococcota bacterium]|nr:PEP-CTERM sorting domain-containing protein [Myxococcota bacterium]